MPGIENTIKQKLRIKWIDARRLAQEAQVSLGIEGYAGDREVEILEEAIRIFEALDQEEQEEMQISAKDGLADDNEWKRKAQEAAERREREFHEREAQDIKLRKSRRKSGDSEVIEHEELMDGTSKVKRVRRLSSKPTRRVVQDPDEIENADEENVKFTSHAICCNVL